MAGNTDGWPTMDYFWIRTTKHERTCGVGWGAGSAIYAYYYCLQANQPSFSSNLRDCFIWTRMRAFCTHETSSHNQNKWKTEENKLFHPTAQWATAPQTRWRPDFSSWVKLSSQHPAGEKTAFLSTQLEKKKKKDLSEKKVMWSSQSPCLLPQLRGPIVSWVLPRKQASPIETRQPCDQ